MIFRWPVLFAALFLIGTLGLLPMRAESAPVCTGKDLIAELRAKDPAAYEQLRAEAANIPNGDSVFWRIDGPPGTKPSWLLGTVHLSDRRVVNLRPETAEALDQARVVAVETADLMSDEKARSALADGTRYAFLPKGITLAGVMSKSDYKLLEQRLVAMELPPHYFIALQPWIVASYVVYPACEMGRVNGGLYFLDEEIARRATAKGKDVVALEDVNEQYALLSSLPLPDQLAFLAATLRQTESLEDLTETTVLAWTKGLSAQDYVMSTAYRGLTDEELLAVGRFRGIFIDRRNLIMRDNAMTLLEKGNAFIAVGSFHLLGENGLVELLRKAEAI